LFPIEGDDNECEPAQAQFRTAARGFTQTERAETVDQLSGFGLFQEEGAFRMLYVGGYAL
jgi:hypothetical protein